ncbi:MAG: hypothetical protein ABEJ73_09240 [Haloplanus sp.]
MNSTAIRNILVVILLGIVATGITYFLFGQLPKQLLAGVYLRMNFAVLGLLLGGVATGVVASREYWFELTGVFLLAFAGAGLLLFASTGVDGPILGLFVGLAVVGAAITWALVQYVSRTVGYRFVALLLTLAFTFVLVYVGASIAELGDPSLLPPVLIYLAIFLVTANSLKKELAAGP